MPTNITAVAAGAVAAGTTGATISWTIVLAIVTVSLTAMATLIKLYGPKTKISEENLRESTYIKELVGEIKEKEDKLNAFKELVYTANTEIEKLKIETKNTSNTIEELKINSRDLVKRIDELLKQFLDYMEG